MRNWGAAIAAVVLAILPASGQEARRSSLEACGVGGRPDRLQTVTPEGDLVLESGGPAKLAGLRLPDDGPLRAEAIVLLRAKTGTDVLLEASPERDRWSRISAVIRLEEGTPALDLGRSLVETGLAIVDLAASSALCRADLLQFEDAARKRSLGVWRDDRYKPIDAGDTERLRASVGRFVLVEGRIRSIGERSQRVYLNFGGIGQRISRSSFQGKHGS